MSVTHLISHQGHHGSNIYTNSQHMNNFEVLTDCHRVNSAAAALFVPALCLWLAQISGLDSHQLLGICKNIDKSETSFKSECLYSQILILWYSLFKRFILHSVRLMQPIMHSECRAGMERDWQPPPSPALPDHGHGRGCRCGCGHGPFSINWWRNVGISRFWETFVHEKLIKKGDRSAASGPSDTSANHPCSFLGHVAGAFALQGVALCLPQLWESQRH